MPFLLRRIDYVKWERDVDWLTDNELKADCLVNLRTDQCTLSVWVVDDSESNLSHIVTALASTSQKLDKVDYALIHQDKVKELDIDIIEMPGVSHYPAVNHLHRDLVKLTVSKITKLAYSIDKYGRKARMSSSDVGRALATAITNSAINSSSLDAKLQADLGKKGLI